MSKKNENGVIKTLSFVDSELILLKFACRCLYDSLDISNSELKNCDSILSQEIYCQNLSDMKKLDLILNKIKRCFQYE